MTAVRATVTRMGFARQATGRFLRLQAYVSENYVSFGSCKVDFNWLNELPDSAWRRWGRGWSYVEVSKDEFHQRSKVKGDQYWEGPFEEWGMRQPRRYIHMNRIAHVRVLAELGPG